MTATPRIKVCPFCAEEIKAAAIVCRYCGRDQPAADAPRPAAGGDVDPVYFSEGSITITRSRATIGDRTYAIANVTSVAIHRIDDPTGCGWLMLVPGVFVLPFLTSRGGGVWLGLVGLVGVIWGIKLIRSRAYELEIRDSSERIPLLMRNKDRAYLQRIADAFNQAFADRA